ncbi:flavodoxin domain-containing protein [Pontibacillus yanchengensis]|uniref:Flavodoxin n=1 Tax=Pontibacillus yanchengensis Y32 TaxID=1385514 RepID=A0A0A2TE52_9BACI|nr:flavodoxin domain-containing protein [Pontibacillus yanchengensis]KGP74132.1 flavodoxin [Pontibacillus yanchengensis Y32]
MKTLILYATKYGSAEKVAHQLATKLTGDVQTISIMKDAPPPLTEFDTVILGGSIYMGTIQKQLSNYVNDHVEELLEKRVGLYICAGEQDPEVKSKELVDSFPKSLYEHAIVKEVVGHEYHFDKMNLVEKLMLRMKGIKKSCSALSDERIDHTAHMMAETRRL